MRTGTLLIRPDQTADPIELALRDRGVPVYKFAIIEIQPLPVSAEQIDEWCNTHWDGVVAISPNAVRCFDKQRNNAPWPSAKHYYTVGAGTAETLAAAAAQPVHYPAGEFTSEGLLELPELQQCAEQQWLIITGENGRSLLADTLSKRGAQVTTAEIYKRVPRVNTLPDEEPKWLQSVETIVVSSVEQARLFWEHLSDDGQAWAKNCTWVVPKGRIADFVVSLGIDATQIETTENAAPPSIIRTLTRARKSTAMTKKDTPDQSTAKATETPSSATKKNEAAAPDKPGPAKLGVFSRFLIFVITCSVLVLAAGGYFVWHEQQKWVSETQAKLSDVNARLAQAERPSTEVRDWSEDINELQDTIARQFEAERRARERGLQRIDTLRLDSESSLQQAIDDNARTTQRLSDELRASNARHGSARHVFEAYDLVTAAVHRLRFEFDKVGAIRLLEAAREVLETQSPERDQTIIRQIGHDIELLEELPSIDSQAIALHVQRLQPRVRSLPFSSEFAAKLQDDAQADISSDISQWRQNLANAWSSFSQDMIKVQRHDELPLRLDHDQRTLILGQMELALQIAQQAALRHHGDLYRNTLRDLTTVIDTYLNTEHTDVRQFKAEVAVLLDLPVEPDYPTRLLSHAMLRDRVSDLHSNSQGE
ncbi:uroporphyrinogen-III synthase [Aliidiomarina indica]|uniref:uroporphyrinogen-III synthase n=1 Tax=Aliidiomarina indica TaxID=2749147 RepID=UPI00188F0FEE|nr:uroporphyrinogen-III synthase [Aliidiomarina indica]